MNRRIPAILLVAGVAVAALLVVPTPRTARAAATCAVEAAYLQCGRVFPDPEGGLGTDPWSEGAIPAGDFIQFGDPDLAGASEIWDGLRFLESRYDRYLDVWRADQLLDEPDALSSGLWLAGQRDRLPLILARVTDETVPAANKRRFVFGLSLHGIERAGVEGGTRALEDLVTYAYCESLGDLTAARADAICAKQTHVQLGEFIEGAGGFPVRLLPWDGDSLTIGEVLAEAELYFTYNNPDGWRRGDRVGGVSHYQRYTGNGVDPNRDWPTSGYTYWPFSPGSEPETKYIAEALRSRGDNWASGIDLHGQGGAPVLTYTMLPAGQNDYAKNARIRAIAETTQRDALERLTWSPMIVPFDEPRRAVNVPVIGPVPQMWPQRWGTVWDTINYTTTGSYGDWINSPIGLDAIGMDNEMSLSHVTNCGIGSCYIAEIEQLHVAGNKGLIYADIDTTLRTETAEYRFPFEGRAAYIRYDNVKRDPGGAKGFIAGAGLPVQDPFTDVLPCAGGCTSDEFEVLGPDDGYANRGVTVNIGFPAPHSTNDVTNAQFSLQRFTVDHDGDEGEWVTVGTHFNQQQAYLSNSATVTLNDPIPGRYRLLFSPTTPGTYTYEVRFSTTSAHADPGQAPYEVTQFDFFDELNEYLLPENRFDALSSGEVLDGTAPLQAYDVLILVNDPLDGWDEEKPKRSALSTKQHKAYYDALRSFARGGGTLIMLDGAMRGLIALTGEPTLEARRIDEYAGYMAFQNADGTTYDDPLAKDVNVAGAAEGSGNRHQTYEPVPLGYSLDESTPGGNGTAPVWAVGDAGVSELGGRIAATVQSQFAVLGEIPMGDGVVRFAGALLPDPSTDYDHPFGLSSYALTWSGWQVFENLLDVDTAAAAPGPKVLGTRKELPATGFIPPLLWFALLVAPAALAARKLRNTYWV